MKRIFHFNIHILFSAPILVNSADAAADVALRYFSHTDWKRVYWR